MGPHASVTQILARLDKQFRPAYKRATEVAVEYAAQKFRENLSVLYSEDGTPSKSPRMRKGKWGKPVAYPKKRSGSLQASVSTTKAVLRGNVYGASFGILKDVLKGSTKSKMRKAQKKRNTLYSQYESRRQSYLRYGGRSVPGAFHEPSMPTRPTLYAQYLATGTNKMGPRKMAKEVWNQIKYSGELREKIKAVLKGVGSRVVPGGPLPKASFSVGRGNP